MQRPSPREAVACVAVAALVLLAVAGVLREVAPDDSQWLVLLATLTPLLYLPAWVIAPVAAALRRWRLLAVAVALVAVHVWWTAPLFVGGRGPLAGAGRSVTVLALNLNGDRATGHAAARLISAVHPDLVVLSEASPLSVAGIDQTAYPVAVSDVRVGTNGWLVLSSWPLLEERRVDIGDRELPRLLLRSPDGHRLVLWQVHPVAPVSGYVGEWRHQLHMVRAAIAVDEHGADPVVVAGDFNATRDVPQFRALLDDGWADVSDGRGLMATWRDGGRLPPLLRLDHVLVSHEVGVRAVHRTGSVGSDHLGLIARLEIR